MNNSPLASKLLIDRAEALGLTAKQIDSKTHYRKGGALGSTSAPQKVVEINGIRFSVGGAKQYLEARELTEERMALFDRLERSIVLKRRRSGCWMVVCPADMSESGAWDGRTYTEELFETIAQFEESGFRKAQRHVRYLKARLRAEFGAGSKGLRGEALKKWESDWYEADSYKQANRR